MLFRSRGAPQTCGIIAFSLGITMIRGMSGLAGNRRRRLGFSQDITWNSQIPPGYYGKIMKSPGNTRRSQKTARFRVISVNLVGLDPRDAQPLVLPRKINDSEHVCVAWKPVFAHGFHGISPEITSFTEFPVTPAQNGLVRPSFTGNHQESEESAVASPV